MPHVATSVSDLLARLDAVVRIEDGRLQILDLAKLRG